MQRCMFFSFLNWIETYSVLLLHLWVSEYEVNCERKFAVIFQLRCSFTFEEKCEMARDDGEICFRQTWMK